MNQGLPTSPVIAQSHTGSPPAGVLRLFLMGQAPGGTGTLFSLAAAALMVTSGAVHLYLWHLAYRHVATLGPLFLVQAAAALVLAVLVAATRRGLFLVAAAGLMAGTLLGFVLVTTVGLFGFTLHSITGWADLALGSEAAAAVLLLTAARLLLGRLDGGVGVRSRLRP
jgi:hypothetical protein